MKSLSQLMAQAFNLSLTVGYSELSPDGHYFTWREDATIPETDWDTISGWADGLMHKFYENRASGHCSLQATIDFDVGAFEEEVKRDIAMMAAHLARVGKPVKLTHAEMRRRGYLGAWAGMTEAETEAAMAVKRAAIEAEMAAREPSYA